MWNRERVSKWLIRSASTEMAGVEIFAATGCNKVYQQVDRIGTACIDLMLQKPGIAVWTLPTCSTAIEVYIVIYI